MLYLTLNKDWGISMAIQQGEKMVATDITDLTFFPKGTILTFSSEAWNDTSPAFKDIWKICDGTDSRTPNLTNKFLRGGGTTSGGTGGQNSQNITLTTNHLPTHTHTQNAHNHIQSAHTHTQDAHTHTQNAHTHTQNSHMHSAYDFITNPDTTSNYRFNHTSSGNRGERTTNTGSTTAVNQNSTAVNQNTTAVNQNATALNQASTAVNQNTGLGQAFTVDTLPSFYTVIYIMKVV